MSFTIILFLLGLLGLGIVFGVTYNKGLKAALIATGIALVAFLIIYVAAIYVITKSM